MSMEFKNCVDAVLVVAMLNDVSLRNIVKSMLGKMCVCNDRRRVTVTKMKSQAELLNGCSALLYHPERL